ncbi:ABC transporter substrate-binding protein [Granulosicoccus sp. 3-233]|uniref:ABC transporter substrate-binding protein n=1 Tax=Granulosicoccus sp. 3-233 TaxID=3417969 RepID=UPI003D32B10A
MSIRVDTRKLLAALLMTGVALSFPVAAQERSNVTIASPWEVASADPAVAGFAIQKLQIMENLVDADVHGKLRPGLATEWSASADGLTWTFTLRDGVRFHDGSELTADNATQALNRSFEQPGVLSKAPISGITAGDGVVIVQLESAFASLPSLLAHATTVIPAPSALDADGVPSELIGTGPFRVTQFSPPQSIDMERFDNYWGEAPAIETASYLAAGRAETRALLAESGDADLVFTLDPAGFARLADVGEVQTEAVAIPRVMMLKVNAAHPFLDDPRARQALSLAIDRAGIATAINRFPEGAATQLFPPVLAGWHDQTLSPLNTDPAAARALLAELGWSEGEDGILVREGERFSLELRTFPDRPELPLIAAALQDQWRGIGIELDVNVSNYSIIPEGHKDGTLEVALYARNYGLTPDPIGTVLQDFAAGGGDWGAMGWQSDAVAGALDTIASSTDLAQRTEAISTVVSSLHAELPVIPVTWYQHTVAIADGLQGVVIDPLQRSYGLSEISWAK